jgi:hypothetical protein
VSTPMGVRITSGHSRGHFEGHDGVATRHNLYLHCHLPGSIGWQRLSKTIICDCYCARGAADGLSVCWRLAGSSEAVAPAVKRRQAQQRRRLQQDMHRLHLLCLLGRGMLMDAAADSPLLQVSVVIKPFYLSAFTTRCMALQR